ncbi:MAG TPA: site-specific integrase [Xanthobacteraceae bacterium]|nr:site-specific integrase [Xanthobacteraceae bacterium]
MKFTTKSIAGLRAPAGKINKEGKYVPGDHVEWDDNLPGFGLRLREGGSRNWVFQYSLGDKQRRMSLGSATAIALVKARETASELHAKVRLGQDPAGQKAESQQRAAETFEAIALQYLAVRKREMRPGAYDQIDRHLLKYAKPLHGLQLAGITQRTMATRINEIRESSGTVQANRARSSLLAFYGWAMQQGIVTQNPVANTGRFTEQSRERILTDGELREIWTEADDDQYGSIVRLLMLNGQRADEMASLRQSEIGRAEVPRSRVNGIELLEFTVDAIELPPERTKNKRPHIVPLSKPALAILEKQPRRVNDDGKIREFVFGVGECGFSGWSKCKERLDKRIHDARMKAWEEAGAQGDKPLPLPHWTHHDLRRTMDTVMNDRLGIAPHVVEAILNHVSSHKSGKSGVAGVYNKALYLRERTEALRLWADHVMALVGANVVPLRQPA